MKNINKKSIKEAANRIKKIIPSTPLQLNDRLSKKYSAEIYLKREDLQPVRSYKLRGALNFMSQLSEVDKKRGVVCASAGNHAQGVAFGCAKYKVKGKIFMPLNTPKQKVNRVAHFGGKHISIELVGDTFDEAFAECEKYLKKNKAVLVHPFDDAKVISGQGSIGVEILEELGDMPDVLILPIGGGGLASGLSTYAKSINPNITIIGVEPEEAASMKESIKQNRVISLDTIGRFVDGAAVKKPGELNFKICSKLIDKIITVPDGAICKDMIELYQNDGIITEPAGTLAITGLEKITKQIKNKKVVAVISGGNNDIGRYPEITEKSLVYQGLKHYFIINFPQRAGALRSFLDDCLGPQDDIVLFEYLKKSNKEFGPALVGIELSKKEDLAPLLKRLSGSGFQFEKIESDSIHYNLLV